VAVAPAGSPDALGVTGRDASTATVTAPPAATVAAAGATENEKSSAGAVASTYSSRSGEPAPGSPTAPGVASASSSAVTCAGVHVGCSARISAAAPVTCGAAIDVPLPVRVAVSPPMEALVMSTPGANRSTHEPVLENAARASSGPVAPTVTAAGTPAGVFAQASALSLPAETT
jgi:hypothetical protein